MQADTRRTITTKPPARKSSRKRPQPDYASLHSGIQNSSDKWVQILQSKEVNGDPFQRINGADLTLEWLESDDSALREPVVIEKPDGLGMKMPHKNFTVSDVATLIGEDTMVEVMGMFTTQSEESL